jgi:FKBP-type peptidyl-prolyl cis-trans isomerase FklB
MKNMVSVLLMGMMAITAPSALAAKAKKPAAKGTELKGEKKATATTKSEFVTNEDKLSYAIGIQIGKSIKNDNITINIPTLFRGIQDSFHDKPLAMSQEEIREVLMSFQKTMMSKQQEALKKMSERNLEESKKFLEENAKKPGVKVLPDGLQYKIIKEGEGASPGATDKVRVNYRGTLVSGREFDSSYKRNQPLEIGVSQVIPGWSEALKMMKVGAKWEIYIPSNLAYKESGYPPIIPPNSALIFDVELLEIVKDNTTAPK